ncbi:MAG: hypothetical protein WKF63_08355 [Thermomicrobiales bacterium]
MDILSPRLISTLRGVTARLRPDTCEVLRATVVEDGGGGSTTVETVTSTVPCRLDASGLQPDEAAIASRLGWEVAYKLDLPVDANVTPSDRLRVNGVRSFQVGGVPVAGNAAVSKIAVVREVG